MAYSDPYENWKAGGRQGGSFDDWSKQQTAAAPQPQQQPQAPAEPQTPAPRQPRQQTQQYGGYQYQPQGTNYQTYQNPTGQQQAQPRSGGNPPGYTPKPGEKVNWGSLTPEQSGIKAWGVEIGNDNRMTSQMTPEQRARWSMEHLDSFDQQSKNPMSREQAYNQWMAWQDSYDESCPPDRPYRAEDGSGCVEKPDNSNKGYMAAGQMNAQGQWTPGGGRGGGQGGGGGYGGGADGDLALYQVKKQYAEALADPTGQKAWQLFAGQGGASSFQDEMDRSRAAIAGMPEGPARDQMMKNLMDKEQSMRLQMPQQARAQAIQGLSGIIQPELGYVGSERDRQLGYFNANTNRQLGLGNLGLGWAGQNLAAQNQMWNQQTRFPWETGQAAAELANSRYGIDAQGRAQSASNWGNIANQGMGLVTDYLKYRQGQNG